MEKKAVRRVPWVCAGLTVVLMLAIGARDAVGFGAAERDAQELVVAISGNPDTLDPHATSGTLTFQTIRSIYDTLIEVNDDGEFEPSLARSWSVDGDGLVWEFELREDVTFHHGEPLRASDVVATLQRVMDPDAAYPKADEFGPVDDVVAADDYVVEFRMDEPHAPLLAALASGWGAVLPRDLIAEGHDFGDEPVGTGPFRFEEWVRDSRISLRRYEEYRLEDAPRLEALTFRIIEEPSVQLEGLFAGSLDAIDMVLPHDLDRVRENPETKLDETLSSLAMVLAINTSREPFGDVRVRRALDHAIDKQEVLDLAYGGGHTGVTFHNVGDRYHPDIPEPYPYDPEEAQRLLEEAGVDLQRTITITVPQNYEAHVQAAQLYQAMLEEVGLSVDIRLVDWSTWLSDVYGAAQYDLTVIGHTGKLDPDARLAGYADGSFYTRWENQEVTRLTRQARRTVDESERMELYERAFRIIAEEVPQVFTGTNYRYIGLRENVEGFRMDGVLDTYDFRHTRIE